MKKGNASVFDSKAEEIQALLLEISDNKIGVPELCCMFGLKDCRSLLRLCAALSTRSAFKRHGLYDTYQISVECLK